MLPLLPLEPLFPPRLPLVPLDPLAPVCMGQNFAVHVALENASKEAMEDAVLAFKATLAQRPGIGLFYFSGHGVAAGGENFLVPDGVDLKACCADLCVQSRVP